jgi:hypothetical protein
MNAHTPMNVPTIVIFAEKRFVGKIICETIATFIPKTSLSNAKNAAKDFANHGRWPYTRYCIWMNHRMAAQLAGKHLINGPI